MTYIFIKQKGDDLYKDDFFAERNFFLKEDDKNR